MAFKNDGGNFSNDLMTKLRSMQNGGSMSLSDIDKSEQIPLDAVKSASGVLGTIGGPLSKLAEGTENAVAQDSVPLWQKIKEAAAKSSVKVLPTAEQAADDAVKQQFQNAPKNFFSNAQQQASQLGVGASPTEQAAMALQKANTQTMLQNRIQSQTEQAKDIPFQKLKRMLSGGQ